MNKSLLLAAAVALLAFPALTHGQVPVLGSTANYALFSSDGAVSSTGLSHITGHVGTNNGSSTNFGNVDGVMHDADGSSAAAATDLLLAYGQLDAATPNFFPAPLLGNGQTLVPGTYSIGESASINNVLTLDGQGSEGSIFIFQVEGALSSSANAQVVLTNGALACNVFWKIEGLVSLAANTVMKGTIVANNSAIVFSSGVVLEGRALSKIGAVTVAGSTIRIPIGCGSPVLTGPAAPNLNTAACYTVFTGNGEVTNSGVSMVTGDVGSNLGLTTGFQDENVDGTIHPGPDPSTNDCAIDVNNAYTYITT
ncbi:MAG TPA: ice-binding family protein, partial [Flavobacterium sp.]